MVDNGNEKVHPLSWTVSRNMSRAKMDDHGDLICAYWVVTIRCSLRAALHLATFLLKTWLSLSKSSPSQVFSFPNILLPMSLPTSSFSHHSFLSLSRLHIYPFFPHVSFSSIPSAHVRSHEYQAQPSRTIGVEVDDMRRKNSGSWPPWLVPACRKMDSSSWTGRLPTPH